MVEAQANFRNPEEVQRLSMEAVTRELAEKSKRVS